MRGPLLLALACSALLVCITIVPGGPGARGALANGAPDAGVAGAGADAISSGWTHTCALKDGAAWCAGDNTHGQLGDGTTTDSDTMVAVDGMETGVTAIAAGDFHTCAIKDGGAWCWGADFNGALGNGAAGNSTVPVAVSGLSSGVSAISDGGAFHHCALKMPRSGAGATTCTANSATAPRLTDTPRLRSPV